jgi:hypothetical protein
MANKLILAQTLANLINEIVLNFIPENIQYTNSQEEEELGGN